MHVLNHVTYFLILLSLLVDCLDLELQQSI